MAVYTEVSGTDLARFLKDYDLGEPLSLNGIADGVENSNFQLLTERGTYVLTLYEKRVSLDDLPFFLELMRHLADKGQPCPRAVPRRDGEVLNQLRDRPAAIIGFLPGLWPRRVSPEHCAEVGRALAEMHMGAADFPLTRDNNLSVAGWRALAEKTGAAMNDIRAGLRDEMSRSLDDLERQWPAGLPQGVIHADLFPDNVFFRGRCLSGLIDFYFACWDFLAYDVAVCLNAWCFEADMSFNAAKARGLLKGYEKVRKLEDAERAALPVLAKGAAMRFLVTRAHDWMNTPAGALVVRKDPLEYAARLRFHARAAGPGAYGLDE